MQDDRDKIGAWRNKGCRSAAYEDAGVDAAVARIGPVAA
jgi:hypothetical protein